MDELTAVVVVLIGLSGLFVNSSDWGLSIIGFPIFLNNILVI